MNLIKFGIYNIFKDNPQYSDKTSDLDQVIINNKKNAEVIEKTYIQNPKNESNLSESYLKKERQESKDREKQFIKDFKEYVKIVKDLNEKIYNQNLENNQIENNQIENTNIKCEDIQKCFTDKNKDTIENKEGFFSKIFKWAKIFKSIGTGAIKLVISFFKNPIKFIAKSFKTLFSKGFKNIFKFLKPKNFLSFLKNIFSKIGHKKIFNVLFGIFGPGKFFKFFKVLLTLGSKIPWKKVIGLFAAIYAGVNNWGAIKEFFQPFINWVFSSYDNFIKPIVDKIFTRENIDSFMVNIIDYLQKNIFNIEKMSEYALVFGKFFDSFLTQSFGNDWEKVRDFLREKMNGFIDWWNEINEYINNSKFLNFVKNITIKGFKWIGKKILEFLIDIVGKDSILGKKLNSWIITQDELELQELNKEIDTANEMKEIKRKNIIEKTNKIIEEQVNKKEFESEKEKIEYKRQLIINRAKNLQVLESQNYLTKLPKLTLKDIKIIKSIKSKSDPFYKVYSKYGKTLEKYNPIFSDLNYNMYSTVDVKTNNIDKNFVTNNLSVEEIQNLSNNKLSNQNVFNNYKNKKNISEINTLNDNLVIDKTNNINVDNKVSKNINDQNINTNNTNIETINNIIKNNEYSKELLNNSQNNVKNNINTNIEYKYSNNNIKEVKIDKKEDIKMEIDSIIGALATLNTKIEMTNSIVSDTGLRSSFQML